MMTSKERIKAIPGHPGYFVSDHGNVYSSKSGSHKRLATSGKNKQPCAVLWTNGKAHTIQISRLVARLFYPEFKEAMTVTFIDGDSRNTHINNLKLVRSSKRRKKVSARTKSKTYWLVSPEGGLLAVTDLPLFCEARGFDYPTFRKAASGSVRSYKGWRSAASVIGELS